MPRTTMRSSATRLVVSTAFASSATALLVTQGSPCEQYCGNVLSSTTGADMTCDESSYKSSSAGIVFESCMNCELTSDYNADNQTDQQWLLYNSRYAISWCLFGDPGNDNVGSSPCVTSHACGPLKGAFEYNNFSTTVGPYDYCASWSEEFVSTCSACLKASSNGDYLANFLTMLDAGCQQKPSNGSAISVDGSIFSTTLMNVTSPTPTSMWENSNGGPISLGGKVGIAIGALVFMLAVAGCCIVWNGKRRRRAFLRRLEMQHRESGWPHPGAGGVRGPNMNETPLSQKPLTGWDDSPQSATASEPQYSRYFSPYSSQYSSPVSAQDEPGQTHWPQNFSDIVGGFPTANQDKAMQDQHECEAGPSSQRPIDIGVALGGDEASLRSKPSNQSFGGGVRSPPDPMPPTETYELHEVSSSAGGSSAGGPNSNSFANRIALRQQAPVLQHPGHGRSSPEKPSPPPSTYTPPHPHGGLTGEDARLGGAI